jgi:hypothetical protein
MLFRGHIAILISTAGFLACNSGTVSKPESKFYYYPELNIYYNSQQSEFLYTVDGGRSWHAKSASNETAESLSKKRIALNTDVFDITQFNEEHRTKYNGITADYTKGNERAEEEFMNDDDADLEAQKDAEQKKKELRKKEEDKKKEEAKEEDKPKERKGLGKILKGIFGKKKQ